jgi:hypothetical protein
MISRVIRGNHSYRGELSKLQGEISEEVLLLNHNGDSNFLLPNQSITGTHVTLIANYVT